MSRITFIKCLDNFVYFMSADWGSCTPSRRHGTGELGGDRPSPVITLFTAVKPLEYQVEYRALEQSLNITM